MTAQERKAASVGKKLALALFALEEYDGDPAEVLEEAQFWLRHGRLSSLTSSGPAAALKALQQHYLEV